MTETAAMADIVLPATTFLEHDDFYTAGGHTYLQLSRGDPAGPMPNAARTTMWSARSRSGSAPAIPGFGLSALELIDRTLRASGLPAVEELPADGWLDCCLPFETAHFLDGFGHADKKFHFRADWAALGREPRAAAALSRPCRGHRRRRSGAAVPPGRRRRRARF